jgi:hypothetical protein
MDFKYKTIFSSNVRPLVKEEKDKYLAMASIIDVGEFIPDVDTDKNIDLLPIAFNACVVNRVNKNGDVIDTSTALEMSKSFINKPINIEHNRDRVVGVVLSAGYSEFGSDKVIEASELKDEDKKPFNITLGAVVWKIVNSELANIIEESSDPTSENYLKVSASWELGFNEYNLVILDEGEKNIENGEFITAKEKIEELREKLQGYGGNGKIDDGKMVYRHVIANVVPLGIGLTESPAADVKGIAVKKKEKKLEKKTEDVSIQEDNDIGTKNANKISQSVNKNVNTTSSNKNIKDSFIMKINSVEDITSESLKSIEASAVHEFIEEQLKQASEKFADEKTAKENALKEADKKYQTLSSEHITLKKEMNEVQSTLEELQAEKTEREGQERFNQRMAQLDEEYELNDQDREVIASDIKDMSDKDFEAYQAKMTVLLSAKSRKAIEAAQAETEATKEKAKAEAKVEEVRASADETNANETAQVVEKAIDEAQEQSQEIPVSTPAEEPTMYDKYKSAFGLDQFDMK